MPVRSLHTAVMRWPGKDEVKIAVQQWCARQVKEHDTLAIGAFGSFTSQSWGVGSDLDILVIVPQSNVQFSSRAAGWDTLSLPVAVDLVVYTKEEWLRMLKEGWRFPNEVLKTALWLHGEPPL